MLSPETGRYAAFHQCLAALERPAGTVVHIEVSAGYSIANARNRVVKAFLDGPGEWLLWLDDDHTCSPDLLTCLLRHFRDDRVDAVVPVCLGRKPPFTPIVLSLRQDLAYAVQADVSTTDRGLMEIGAAGGGGLLVRRRVFEHLPSPWFAPHPERTEDESVSEGGEDIYFCQELRRAGFRLFCDFDLPIGHITPVAIWPSRRGSDGYGFAVHCLQHGSDTASVSADLVRSYTAAAALSPAAAEADAVGCVVAAGLARRTDV